MKQFKYVLVVVILLGSLTWAFAAHAQGPGEPLRGEITDVTDTTITVYTSEGEYVVVNVNAETTVYVLLTQTECSVADLQKLTAVQVMGRPNDDGSVDASMIVVTPWGDVVRGEITAVDAEQGTITVGERMPPRPGEDGATDNVATAHTVAVDDGTQILIDGIESLISDLTVGKFAAAYGETQEDGSLVATTVIVNDEPQGFGGRPEPRGPGPGGHGGEPGQGERQRSHRIEE